MHLITSMCKPRRSQLNKSIENKTLQLDASCLLCEHRSAFTVRATRATVSQSTRTALSVRGMLDGVAGAPSYTTLSNGGMTDDGVASRAQRATCFTKRTLWSLPPPGRYRLLARS